VNRQLPVAQRVQSGIDGVDLREKHVIVVEVTGGVHHPLVGLEEHEVQGNLFGVGLVGEIRVSVDEEGRSGFGLEAEDGSQARSEVGTEGSGRRRIGGLEDG